MRDLLEKELLESARQGDTTVLAEILNNTFNANIYASLSDEGQATVDKINRFLVKYGERSLDHTPEVVEAKLVGNYQVRWNGNFYYISKELSGLTEDESAAYEYLRFKNR